jgi:hypothetical protein
MNPANGLFIGNGFDYTASRPTKEAKGNYDAMVKHLKKKKIPEEVWPKCAIGKNKRRAPEDVGKSKNEMKKLDMQRCG